jgi:hypothetical protein
MANCGTQPLQKILCSVWGSKGGGTLNTFITTPPFTLDRAATIAAELTAITGDTWQAHEFRGDRYTLTNANGRENLSIGEDGQSLYLLKTYGMYWHNGQSVRPSLPGPCATIPAAFTDQAIAQDIVDRLLRPYRFYLALAIAETRVPYLTGSHRAIQSRQRLVRDQFDKGSIPEPLDEAVQAISELLSL